MTRAKEVSEKILAGLTTEQAKAVKSPKRRLLVVAGAGSGKTEVMARRVAWWVAVEKVPKESIVAFTFTERAADEMKFRIRTWLERVAEKGEEVALGDMYIGTIHGFCLAKLREYWPDEYHNYDILDEASRNAFISRGFNGVLGMAALRSALGRGQYATIEEFTQGYDQLHEHDEFEIELPADPAPSELGQAEREWCVRAELLTDVGEGPVATAFGRSAARYYAYMRCRRFLDFSTSQSEFLRQLRRDRGRKRALASQNLHLVVDEVQDINPVQHALINALTSSTGALTAVGDHRQAIYGFRGADVEIIAKLWEKFVREKDSAVIDLRDNFRSTPRIISLANRWAATIGPVRSMRTQDMTHGAVTRKDCEKSHLMLRGFEDRESEADWIAQAIKRLVPDSAFGALHDQKDGSERGITYSDVAILIRSSTSVREYMNALESVGIPCIVRAGPDLFSQPEVLVFLAALALSAGVTEFVGGAHNPKSLPSRIQSALACDPIPEIVLRAAGEKLRQAGLNFDKTTENRLVSAAKGINDRITSGRRLERTRTRNLKTPKLVQFLSSGTALRRVFPQQLFHFLLAEAGVSNWDGVGDRGQTALFHLGALSGLVTGLETPGWTNATEYRWQIIALCQYGAEEARAEEQPLLVQPDAVSICTIHGVKGLEFAAVFLADVKRRRFPSNFARREPRLPLSGPVLATINADALRDNANTDGERRLMYVALTRAERFLFITHSAPASSFVAELEPMVRECGGVVASAQTGAKLKTEYLPQSFRREVRLSTSFSDLRYYLECPHDFYFRKVLGFAPTIDQAFGYGRGVHNLLRAIHAEPKRWAGLRADRNALEAAVRSLLARGLFYLRYTTGEPATRMWDKGVEIVADYVERYGDELASLSFEPEKPFETLVEYSDGNGGALISGAIDVVREDDPPRVTLVDFKSGDPDSDRRQKLDEVEMRLQVALYAIAAKKELEYEPEQGLVRYLNAANPDESELKVPFDPATLLNAKSTVATTAQRIREREFHIGPTPRADGSSRCAGCDFTGVCGTDEAAAYKSSAGSTW